MTTAFYNSPFQKMNMTHEADIVSLLYDIT